MRLPVVLLALVVTSCCGQNNRNLDRFNYGNTQQHNNYTDFGPTEWGNVQCPDPDSCQGWPDTWEYRNGWDLNGNHCRWCPDDRCGVHHQSPIALNRNVVYNETELHNQCIDVHWMGYRDSTCTFNTLRERRAFQIDRHALKVVQPIKMDDFSGKYRLDCKNDVGRRWGRIDFSRGFSAWWHLSHIDFHVPSEHTQGGKRYDGELQMYHFYSKTGEEAGIDNEMASVTVFLEVYEDAQDFDVLNRLICAWREEEDRIRAQCGMDSVQTEYPGCRPYSSSDRRRTATSEPALSVHDILMANHQGLSRNESFAPKMIQLEEEDPDTIADDIDWDSIVAQEYHRDLSNYEHIEPWFNYFAMLAVRTEYYYRYSGTQTVPPCYGHWFPQNNRRQTNHWRIMKDPIRVSKRQLHEMHRLLRERIAPLDDPVSSCQADTAARVETSGRVHTNRPLQSNHKAHYTVFCECDNWKSKWKEDQDWCRMDKAERLFQQPYNFATDGF